MRNCVRHAIAGLIAFFALSLPAQMAHAVQLSTDQLQIAIATDLKKVAEFEAIKAEATKRGLRVWLFGGTAASFGHYAKWDEERKLGDTKYQPERFDYDYTNIYRSTQDMDLAVDGTPEQSESFKAWLTKEYPYFEGDKGAGWDVRSLKHKTERMDALLNDKDFSNQHTDSNSTGMIEITDPPAGEVRIRDVRAWDSKTPPFFDDVLGGKLHFYYSPEHKTTRLYKEGSNPEITSVIRYLTKAFQYDLKIPPSEEAKIKPIIDSFNASDVGAKPEYSNWKNWIEKHGKKLMRHAVDMEYSQTELDRLGLRQKLITIRNDAATEDTLAWWLSKEPLKSRLVGQGSSKTARELATSLGVRPGDPIIVTHETNNLLAHESITKSHRGELNAFISRSGSSGETAAEGNGFYTQLGEEGARGTKLPIRMTLNPDAREGTDFTLKPGSRYFVITNKNAVTVIPESLNIAPVEYFRMLATNSEILENNKAVAERFRRRVGTLLKTLTVGERMEIASLVEKAIPMFNGEMSSPLIDAGYDIAVAQNPKLKEIYESRLEHLIVTGHRGVHMQLAAHEFSKPRTENMRGALEKLIRMGDSYTRAYLLTSVFSQPHTKDKQDLLAIIFQEGGQNEYRCLARYVFSQPHAKDMAELMTKVIAKSDQETLRYFAEYTFSQLHTKDMRELFEEVIAKADDRTLQSLAISTFSQPHTKDMGDLVAKVIAKTHDDAPLRSLAEFAFSQPHTKSMDHVLAKLIEKGGRDVQWNLAQHAFSKPHTKDMEYLLVKLIDKIHDPRIFKLLEEHTFSQPHMRGADHEYLREYLIQTQESWKLYPHGGKEREEYLKLHRSFHSPAPQAKHSPEDACKKAVERSLGW